MIYSIEPSNQNLTNMINFFKVLFTEEGDFKVFELKKMIYFKVCISLYKEKIKVKYISY